MILLLAVSQMDLLGNYPFFSREGEMIEIGAEWHVPDLEALALGRVLAARGVDGVVEASLFRLGGLCGLTRGL